MDAISNNDSNRVSQAYKKPSEPITVVSTNSLPSSNNVQLTDLSTLATKAASAGDDIRPEAVERAKLLLSDPNWLNDDAIEGLADKLLSTEDFAG